MRPGIVFIIATLYTISTLICSCKHENREQLYADSGYPKEVANIMVTKCAIEGCHNKASYHGADDLLLEKWSDLFEGGSNGAVVVPYSPENSSLLYFINTDSSLGPVATPTMPYDAIHAPATSNPLSAAEYQTIRNWIVSGAPDAKGNIPFAADANTRQKIYITMQGCDLLAVVDAEKKIVMRYISIGKDATKIESAHCVRVDSSGQYAYVSFLSGQYVQKIDTRTDIVVADAYVGVGSWNVLRLSNDGKQMLVSDWLDPGKILLINAETMQVAPEFGGDFRKPHGIASNAAFNIFYITSESENFIYKFSFTPALFKKVPVDVDGAPTHVIHEISMTPDYSRYFITCSATNQVRVMDAVADTLISVIPVGKMPLELSVSNTTPFVFVTCMEDDALEAGYRGSVYAINYITYTATRIDGPFYQPHGIVVDDQNGVFYVISRNANPNGPAPHHSSACGGRNGYYNAYDLHTFQRLPRRYEVTVDPYSADARFK